MVGGNREVVIITTLRGLRCIVVGVSKCIECLV